MKSSFRGMRWIVLTLGLACGRGELSGVLAEPAIGEGEAGLFVKSSAVWPAGRVPVCWLSPPTYRAPQKALVRAAVQNTWEAVAGVEFVDWGTCTDERNGIRIAIRDAPASSMLGVDAVGHQETMVLNFDMLTHYQQCREWGVERCLAVVAVHEFGHALALDHEHGPKLPTTPAPCEEGAERRVGSDTVGPWPKDSVMSYCSPSWTGNGALSPADVEAARTIYGPPKLEAALVVTLNGRTWAAARRDDRTLEIASKGLAGWSQWYSLGGCFSSAPVLVSNGSRLEVFAEGCDRALWHRTLGESGTEGAWESRGGVLTSRPAAASWPDGRVDVFVRGVGGALWTRKLRPEGQWSDWESLGGVLYWEPSVIRRGESLDVVAVGVDRDVWRRSFRRWVGWSDWEPLGGVVFGPVALSAPSAERLDVLAEDDRGRLTQRTLTEAGWSPWSVVRFPQPGQATPIEPLGRPQVAAGPGGLDVFYTALSGLSARASHSPSTGWLPASAPDLFDARAHGAVRGPSGVALLVQRPDGTLVHTEQVAGDLGWIRQELASTPAGRAVCPATPQGPMADGCFADGIWNGTRCRKVSYVCDTAVVGLDSPIESHAELDAIERSFARRSFPELPETLLRPRAPADTDALVAHRTARMRSFPGGDLERTWELIVSASAYSELQSQTTSLGAAALPMLRHHAKAATDLWRDSMPRVHRSATLKRILVVSDKVLSDEGGGWRVVNQPEVASWANDLLDGIPGVIPVDIDSRWAITPGYARAFRGGLGYMQRYQGIVVDYGLLHEMTHHLPVGDNYVNAPSISALPQPSGKVALLQWGYMGNDHMTNPRGQTLTAPSSHHIRRFWAVNPRWARSSQGMFIPVRHLYGKEYLERLTVTIEGLGAVGVTGCDYLRETPRPGTPNSDPVRLEPSGARRSVSFDGDRCTVVLSQQDQLEAYPGAYLGLRAGDTVFPVYLPRVLMETLLWAGSPDTFVLRPSPRLGSALASYQLALAQGPTVSVGFLGVRFDSLGAGPLPADAIFTGAVDRMGNQFVMTFRP